MPADLNHAGRPWVWPLAVVMIFTVSLSVSGFTIYAATSDASHAVEHDYYARAVAWDETAAQRSRNAELGWGAQAEVGMPAEDESRTLTIMLGDASGAALSDLYVEAFVFHHARRNDAKLYKVTPAGEGRYSVALPDAAAGIYQVRLRAERTGERFTAIIDTTTPDGHAR